MDVFPNLKHQMLWRELSILFSDLNIFFLKVVAVCTIELLGIELLHHFGIFGKILFNIFSSKIITLILQGCYCFYILLNMCTQFSWLPYYCCLARSWWWTDGAGEDDDIEYVVVNDADYHDSVTHQLNWICNSNWYGGINM